MQQSNFLMIYRYVGYVGVVSNVKCVRGDYFSPNRQEQARYAICKQDEVGYIE
ncbi:hypothetical protein [Alkalihalobacterium alkalinitrilicum]|uniref:hypothetical protein n=1 Tax=Alkalihalobacterium alkalinitrilicum TaxID=427920 RepID=UPI001303DE9A|nr:hypothetical protein [Alkalihalobacterium alkalinitrilicum]